MAEYAGIMSFCLLQNNATLPSKENAMEREKDRMPVVTRNIAVVGFEGAEILDIVGPLEVFNMANFLLREMHVANEPAYNLCILAREKGLFRSFSGVKLVADYSWKDFPEPIDTLFVAGGPDVTPLAEDGPQILFRLYRLFGPGEGRLA
jgi:transcriptional regulator GlxA family with amidase domain